MDITMQTLKSFFTVGTVSCAMALSACQTLPIKQATQNPKLDNQLATAATPAHSALSQALQATLRSAFSYHSQIEYSNHLREQALANATPEQLRQSDDFLSACEHTHDNDYVALAKRAILDGVDISSDRYIDERTRIKQDFLACKERFDTALDESAGEPTVPKDYGNYTQLDAKKALLLKDYWFNATSVQVSGNYQPLSGVISALPTATYQSRNANLMVNQPMVLDFKVGKLYLWADNLALANATWLDKELGLAWQNKWLAIELNDGSLPKDFVRELGKAYADSKILSTSKNTDYLSQDEFDVLIQASNKTQKAVLTRANQVIVENHAGEQSLRQFYQTMTQKFPVLLDKPADPEKVVLDSKTLMQRTFALIKKRLDKQLQAEKMSAVSYYGLNNGKLVWHYHHNYLTADKKSPEPVSVKILTHLDNRQTTVFGRLPTAHQTPNADNQVDLLQYGNKLLENLKKGDDTSVQLVARTLLAVLVGFDAPIGAEAENENEVETPEGETNQDF